MIQESSLSVCETQHVAILSQGVVADALVQALCVAAPAPRVVYSATGVSAPAAAHSVEQWQEQAWLGAVVCVVEQGSAEAAPWVAAHTQALQGRNIPVFAVVVPYIHAPAVQWVPALRAQCAGVLLLPTSAASSSPFAQLQPLQQFDAALRTALDVDTAINLHLPDIVDCMVGQYSQIHVKTHGVDLSAWTSQVLAHCQQAVRAVHAWGVFADVPRDKPLSSVRSIQRSLAQGLPHVEHLQLHTWYAEAAGPTLPSFAIVSY